MNQLLHFLRRRGSVRTLLLLLVLAMTGSALFTLAALRPRNEEPLKSKPVFYNNFLPKIG